MTDSISDPEHKSGAHRPSASAEGPGYDGVPSRGPDPAIGAGVTLLGIVLMGIAGARDAHYVFDAGVVTAVLGAATFVLFVALSAMKQKPRSS